MPPLDKEVRHLVDYLLEVGPAMGTGMGEVPVSHLELQAWQQQVGIDLQPWEVRTLRRLSRDWVVESHKASSPSATAPWRPDEDVNRQTVDSGLRSLFDGLIARQQGKATAAENRRTRRQQLRAGGLQ